MQSYACINCGRLVTEKNTMCLDCKTAYEKGVRDMFKRMYCTEDCEEENECKQIYPHTFKTCPIAQKLLKAVK